MDCVYILHSQKLNRIYTGFTTDFETRLEYHKKDQEQNLGIRQIILFYSSIRLYLHPICHSVGF